METEHEQTNPNYWNSVLIASLITALIVTIFSIIGGYRTIASEPSGTFFSAAQIWGLIGCLLGAAGGIIVNWHYTNEYDVSYKIGKGALLGLLVGLVGTVFVVILTQLWNVIDPSYTEALMDWNMQNLDAMQMPEEAREQAMEGFENPNSLANIGWQALGTFIGLGILNVISGMVGAKMYAEE